MGIIFFDILKYYKYISCNSIIDVAEEYIEKYKLKRGAFDITADKHEIPLEDFMGEVYARLFIDSKVKNLVELYSLPVCAKLDNYDTGAYYETREMIANNFSTPLDRFYGYGYYCTEDKAQAIKWSKIYGGSVKEFKLSLDGLKIKRLSNITKDYIPGDEDLLIAPLPDSVTINDLYSNYELLSEIESHHVQVFPAYILRGDLPKTPHISELRLYTNI